MEQLAAYVLALLSVVMSAMLVIKLRAPYSLIVWFPNLVSGALAPIWFAARVAGAGLGLAFVRPQAVVVGLAGAIVMSEFLTRSPHVRPEDRRLIDAIAHFEMES